MKKAIICLLGFLSALLLSSCSSYNDHNIKNKPVLTYKEVDLHNINSKIFANKYYYLELTPNGDVYKYYYVNNTPKKSNGTPELLFSSPDIIDISINGSIAYLDKNGKVSLYDTEKNKQEEIGYVPNSKSIIIPYNNEKYDFYVLTNNNDLYVKGSFSGGQLAKSEIVSQDKFVKVEGIPKIKKIQLCSILTTDGRLFTQGLLCNKYKDIYEEKKYNVPIIDFADEVNNLIALGNDGNVYQYGNVNSGVANKDSSELVKVNVATDVIGISGNKKSEYALCRNGEIVFWGNVTINETGKSQKESYFTDKIKPFKNPTMIQTASDKIFIRDNDKVYYVYIDVVSEK